MSERGLLLALQRLHDDPGFVDQVAADPQSTLGIYDLDENECNALIGATNNKDEATLRNMAQKVGIDWTADHISGAGSIYPDDDIDNPANTHLTGPGVTSGPLINNYTPDNVAPYGADAQRDLTPNVDTHQ